MQLLLLKVTDTVHLSFSLCAFSYDMRCMTGSIQKTDVVVHAPLECPANNEDPTDNFPCVGGRACKLGMLCHITLAVTVRVEKSSVRLWLAAQAVGKKLIRLAK